MSVYERVTRKCGLGTMTPALAAAIREWGADLGLTAVVQSGSAACETVSERRHAGGIYGRMRKLPAHLDCGALLTPAWLIWATIADGGEPRAIGVRLTDFDIIDYRAGEDYARLPDSGLQVSGRIGDDPELRSVFIGLGEDAPGQAFKEKVLTAWRQARQDAAG